MNIEEIRQHHEYLVRLSRLNMNNENWKRIDFLLSEIDRLRADRQLESDIDLPPGVLTLKRGYEEMKAALAEKERECEEWKAQARRERDYREIVQGKAKQLLEIERYTAKRVAGECAEIAENHQPQEFSDGCGTGRFIARTIRKKYGVEPEHTDDLITECKKAVIRAALGIQALGESELLDRLENLYLEGVKTGYRARSRQPEHTE